MTNCEGETDQIGDSLVSTPIESDTGARSSVKILLSKSHGMGYSLPRVPQPPLNGTSHGGLRDSNSERIKNTPLPSPRIGTSHGGLT